MPIRANIPLADDLGVFARAWSWYLSAQDRASLRVAVLAQRVIIEKVRATYKKRGKLVEVQAEMDRIMRDQVIRHRYAQAGRGRYSSLADMYPGYVKAGLLRE